MAQTNMNSEKPIEPNAENRDVQGSTSPLRGGKNRTAASSSDPQGRGEVEQRREQLPGRAGAAYEITRADLPLHCPMKGMSLWNSHPRVFLPIEDSGEERCPYCGTLYILKDK